MCIPVAISITHKGNPNRIQEKHFIDISNNWSLDGIEDNSIQCKDFGKNMNENSGILNVYYKIPDQFVDSYLVYRSKDVYTKIFVDDTLLYETKVYESHLYNASPGNIWNSVKISNEYVGKTLRMEIHMVYDSKAITVDHIFLGNKSDIIFSYIKNKLNAIIISFMMIITGLMLIVINIYNIVRKKISSLGDLSLALYSIFVGIWSLCETNVLQFFVDDVRMIQLIDNMFMFVGMMPMLFFIDSHYDILRHKAIRYFCHIDLAVLTYCFIIQVTGISDFHHVIFLAWTAFLVFAIILFATTTKSIIKKFKTNTIQITNFLHIIGFILLTITGIFESIKYAGTDGSDRAEILRFGMLLFIVCFAIGNQINNYKMIAKGAQFELIKNLAYKDGLTELGNRTSYLEKLNSLVENNIKRVGIVFLDINNLKQINDNYGHEAGDESIKEAANIIKSSFGKYGDCYRIGGDEFCVFIQGIDISTTYEEAKSIFEDEIITANNNPKKEIGLQIAHGFALYDINNESSLDDKIKEADELMYTNKAELKSK